MNRPDYKQRPLLGNREFAIVLQEIRIERTTTAKLKNVHNSVCLSPNWRTKAKKPQQRTRKQKWKYTPQTHSCSTVFYTLIATLLVLSYGYRGQPLSSVRSIGNCSSCFFTYKSYKGLNWIPSCAEYVSRQPSPQSNSIFCYHSHEEAWACNSIFTACLLKLKGRRGDVR